jgi:integrase
MDLPHCQGQVTNTSPQAAQNHRRKGRRERRNPPQTPPHLRDPAPDIVTVQKLLGHSDIDATRQYLIPDEDLKRQAVNRLSLPNLKETQA